MNPADSMTERPRKRGAGRLTLGHDQTEADAYHLAAVHLRRAVADFDAPISLEICPDARLGNEMDMLDSVRLGRLDMAVVTVANAGFLVPELELFSVPYLFSGPEHFRRVAGSEAFNRLLDQRIEAHQPALKRLATITPGVRSLFTSCGPVEGLEDLRNLKMRVMASAVEAETWRRFGTAPTHLPFAEIPAAMRTGRVAGAEDTAAVYYAQRHYEFAPYFALTAHQWSLGMVFMNRARWQGLPQPSRLAVDTVGKGLTDATLDYALTSSAAALKHLRSLPGVTVTAPSPLPFQDRVKDLKPTVARRLDAEDVLELIERLG